MFIKRIISTVEKSFYSSLDGIRAKSRPSHFHPPILPPPAIAAQRNYFAVKDACSEVIPGENKKPITRKNFFAFQIIQFPSSFILPISLFLAISSPFPGSPTKSDYNISLRTEVLPSFVNIAQTNFLSCLPVFKVFLEICMKSTQAVNLYA